MPSPMPPGQVQINFRAPVWMRNHLHLRAEQESRLKGPTTRDEILRRLILADLKRNPTGADQAAA